MTKTQLAHEGTNADDIQIAAVGSFYQADGKVLSATIFNDGSVDDPEPKYSAFEKQSTYWGFTAQPDLYLPLGNDVRMDLLAFAAYPGLTSEMKTFHPLKKTDPNPSASETWDPYFSYEDNFAKMVRFFGVDTYDHPVDLMYASCNGLSNTNPTGTLHFKHATADVIFNVKFHYYGVVNTQPEFFNIVFIDPTANNYALKDYIYGTTSAFSSPDEKNVTLYTKGDLTIDNSKNKLEAKWSNVLKDDMNYELKYDSNYNVVSCQNTNSSVTQVLDPASLGSPNEDQWYQLGNELLVPVQPKPNFSIYYKMNDLYYLYEVNAPRGIWEMGKKYIYNVTINWTAVNFTCDVEEWVLGDEHNLDII
jgi:hypothetical protein